MYLSTIFQQVSVCDDYSLPVDFVKKIDPNAAILGSAKSLHLPTSHTAPSPLTADIAGSAGHLDRHPHGSEQRLPKVISGYSHPKDHQIEVVEECESNDQLCSSGMCSACASLSRHICYNMLLFRQPTPHYPNRPKTKQSRPSHPAATLPKASPKTRSRHASALSIRRHTTIPICWPRTTSNRRSLS